MFWKGAKMSEIKIYVAEQLDGYTCRLEPRSKAAIKDQIPKEPVPVTSVFISYDNKANFELIHGSIWKHIAELLTSLPVEELQEIGRIVFVDPKTKKSLFEPLAQHV